MSNIHHDFVAPKPTQDDKLLLRKFEVENKIKEGFSYRKGAAFTAQFGIEEGWGPNWENGYVRIHSGVDRARGGTVRGVNDVVVCPFNFDSTGFKDYNNKDYGSLIFLTSKTYQFEMRIAHMHPTQNIIPWSLKQFLVENEYKQDWLIGSAGTYGNSTGPHTHTELLSIDESCEIFELLLFEKHGYDAFREYSDEEIITFYRQQTNKYPQTSPYMHWNDGQILNDWLNQKRNKKIFFINKYKYCFFFGKKTYTRYASNQLFDGF